MQHVTLITGHVRESPRHEVSDDVIETMAAWIRPGEHLLPVPGGYKLIVPIVDRGFVATVMQADNPVATIGVAVKESESDYVWSALCKIQRAVMEPVATMPPAPWVAAALLISSPATMDWLGDFERCLAWTYLTQSQ